MSWDIRILSFPASVRTVADIPKDFLPSALGLRADLIAQIHEVIPTANFSIPDWGVFDGEGFSIEFGMGKENVCEGITLRVHGGGNPIPLIADLLGRLRFRALDFQTCEFFDVEIARASFDSWQQYRDKIIGKKDGSNQNK